MDEICGDRLDLTIEIEQPTTSIDLTHRNTKQMLLGAKQTNFTLFRKNEFESRINSLLMGKLKHDMIFLGKNI